MKILVVDDEKLIRWFMGHALRKCGHSVETASSVAEAREIFKKSAFDKVSIDMKMPGENGMVLVEDLLGTGYPPGQIIVCSASVSREQQEALERRGITILWKPFTVEDLRHTVNGVGERPRTQSAVRVATAPFPL